MSLLFLENIVTAEFGRPFLSPLAFWKEVTMTDVAETGCRLQDHVRALTETIGERSVFFPRNLERAAGYIEST